MQGERIYIENQTRSLTTVRDDTMTKLSEEVKSCMNGFVNKGTNMNPTLA